MKIKLLGIAALAILLAIVGVQLASRASKPSLLAAELSTAIMRARASLPRFRERLEHRLPTDRAFFLRAQFVSTDKQTEYLWLNHVEISNGEYRGAVAESPALVASIKQGMDVVVPRPDIVDWTIVHTDGTREGDFTQGLEPTRH